MDDINDPEYKLCRELTLKREGGFSNEARDPGGATDFGITQANYNQFRMQEGLEIQDVRLVTADEVARFYQAYWFGAHCPELIWPLDFCVFQWAVNHGTRGAIKTLQESLGLTPDGWFGPKTREAVQMVDPAEQAAKFLLCQDACYDKILAANPSLERFRKGWKNRVAEVASDASVDLAQDMTNPAQVIAPAPSPVQGV